MRYVFGGVIGALLASAAFIAYDATRAPVAVRAARHPSNPAAMLYEKEIHSGTRK